MTDDPITEAVVDRWADLITRGASDGFILETWARLRNELRAERERNAALTDDDLLEMAKARRLMVQVRCQRHIGRKGGFGPGTYWEWQTDYEEDGSGAET